MNFQRGDHLRVARLAYWHHGIYVGNNQVIHFSGEKKDKFNAQIRYDSLETFLNGDNVEIVHYTKCNSPDRTIEIAESLLNSKDYGFFSNNCEHFCSYCKTNEHRSTQAENTKSGAGTGVAGGLGAAATIGALSAAGTTAGVSTVAGVTSGLATAAGSLAVGVIGTAALPAAATIVAVNVLIQDDESLPEKERDARTAAKVGATLGAVGGGAAAVTAVSVLGSTAGIGTVAGVTSGLAAVGGSLVGGVIVTAAAPVAVATAFGWIAYKIFRK